jgi:hypothetical protein
LGATDNNVWMVALYKELATAPLLPAVAMTGPRRRPALFNPPFSMFAAEVDGATVTPGLITLTSASTRLLIASAFPWLTLWSEVPPNIPLCPRCSVWPV